MDAFTSFSPGSRSQVDQLWGRPRRSPRVTDLPAQDLRQTLSIGHSFFRTHLGSRLKDLVPRLM